ncbi:NAD-dependent epimerase/dehydratase family protein [Sandaracinus amylolyticus]|uniref:UDP-glucose 4-epimerase n=1 Tax=Sandaracinus amylolyticus TaxID=927083 RepID=A0A0F6W4K1_9BACT|nr:NAD(P)-dependent oxidoreductase [Sandaracinus amylolyticus]AKF07146.1 UDP-glucose 4-epimerase [Sandaracinus amylolyticus]
MPETLLVTGAAGTVGNYVVGLAEAAGYRVIASDLHPKGVAVPVRGEVRPGDIRDRAFLDKLVKGVDHVIHTAAMLDVGAPFETLAAVNSEAVVALYDAAARAGAKRFVHVSTAMLYAQGQDGPLTEESRILPRGPHGRTKHEAERALLERSERGGPAWTILRPAPLYGRRGRHYAASLLVIGPVLRLLTPVLPRWRGGPVANLVHAEDVARAGVFVLGKRECEGEIYNVADDDRMTLGDRISETYRAYGLPTVPAGQLPRPVLDRIGQFFQRDAAYTGLDRSLLAAWKLVVLRHRLKPALRARLDREALTLLYDDLPVDTGKLRVLGWKPRFPTFVEGWRQVLRWYQAERWVPRYA